MWRVLGSLTPRRETPTSVKCAVCIFNTAYLESLGNHSLVTEYISHFLSLFPLLCHFPNTIFKLSKRKHNLSIILSRILRRKSLLLCHSYGKPNSWLLLGCKVFSSPSSKVRVGGYISKRPLASGTCTLKLGILQR